MDKIKELSARIQVAARVSVVVHTHPDGDALGSGMALVGYLGGSLGKDAVLVAPDSVPESLAFIPAGFPEGSLMVYGDDPERASGSLRESDLLFCLDCPDFSRTNPGMEAVLKSAKAPKVLVDHHLNPSSGSFDIVFSQTDISSTCELLFGILKRLPGVDGDLSRIPMSSLEALMTGMTTDTNNLANSVFPGTLEMASELIAAGVDRDRILDLVYNRYRENRLRLMGYLLHDIMRITPQGVAYMILDKEIQDRFDFRQGESEGFVNIPLAVSSVRMSVLLTEEDRWFRVSVRSKRGVSANRFAREHFHGGGHEMAAGGRLYFPEDIPSHGDAEAYILKVTEEFFRR
ncbi:MAG: bifunctional oligoribonuclease/PAP phosphatase NrnA [Bacteroidales bacterium]|nr:bifunctional oligoribonuclease/PAP phosphatase NrnA [Bacteroidales bacterium]